jgi:hypothetical protein
MTMENNIFTFPTTSSMARPRRAEYRARVRNRTKNMHTFLFRSTAALLEADEEELVRDVSLDLDKATKKLDAIRKRLKGVQENAAAEVQCLTVAESKLAAAIVEALLSGQR